MSEKYCLAYTRCWCVLIEERTCNPRGRANYGVLNTATVAVCGDSPPSPQNGRVFLLPVKQVYAFETTPSFPSPSAWHHRIDT